MADRNELLWGHSGTGKSEGIARVIKTVLQQRPGKKARVWVGDGSGATYKESGLVDAGLVQLASWENRPWPVTTLNQIAEGYFPADVNDPTSPLLPPTPDDMHTIAVWAFEGLTVAGGYLMGDSIGGYSWRAARGEKIGQDSPIRYKDCVTDRLGNCVQGSGPGTESGGSAPAHYGEAQKKLLTWIGRAKSLPGDFMFMTAHERAAEDKTSNEKVIGPGGAGGAQTPLILGHFNNTLHFVTAEKRDREKDAFTGKLVEDLDVEHRVYTRAHVSPTTMMKYLAQTRGVSEADMPAYIPSPLPGDGLVEFYRILADIRRKRVEALKA